MQEYYKILGVSANATDEEIDQAYKVLKDKYSRERFYEGEVGNEAARNLTKLETAYHEITASRKKQTESETIVNDYSEIEQLIKSGNLSLAQEKLDNFSTRDAEWHYLQSVVFYKKNWINESKMQLEIAINKEPHNSKYSDAYTKLKQKIEYNDRQFHNNSYGYNNQYGPEQDRQMGGANSCLSFCATWCCMDMLCTMCCR